MKAKRKGNAVVVLKTMMRAAPIPVLIYMSATAFTISLINRMPNRRGDRPGLTGSQR
jgi:hypothetical protein